ncbi:MAG: alpha-L-glutamate ligase [Symploca sp. SIO3E6]|nr:alpha-L-glutamate ligase [Caldora sp. SIO3E6]
MLTNIRVLIAACQDLNIDFEFLHPARNFVKVIIKHKPYFFVNYATPFNTQSNARIFLDKGHNYHLLKDKINTPKTVSFLSPFCEPNYREYLDYRDIDAIVAEINKRFAMPVIIKSNQGYTGKNVFFCQDRGEVELSIKQIFNVNSKDYDYVALAQEYINISHEYRAIIFNGELLLLYEKNKANANFVGNLSPLHWEGAKAVHITERQLMSEMEEFIKPIFTEIPLIYAGADIAIDANGKFWLIELNSSPNYSIFIRDNEERIVIEMFKKMLKTFSQ